MLIVDETELKIGSKNWCDKSRRSGFFFFFLKISLFAIISNLRSIGIYWVRAITNR